MSKLLRCSSISDLVMYFSTLPSSSISAPCILLSLTQLKALCHNEQTAGLFLNFGFGHVLQYTPFILNFSALRFTHSYTTQEGVPKLHFDTPSFCYIVPNWHNPK